MQVRGRHRGLPYELDRAVSHSFGQFVVKLSAYILLGSSSERTARLRADVDT
jgi:hypothetical protein